MNGFCVASLLVIEIAAERWPRPDGTKRTVKEVPLLDAAVCTGCRACADLCQFKAIAALGGKIVVFAEQCHGCGGCMAVCPEGALVAGSRVLGSLEEGVCDAGRLLSGRADGTAPAVYRSRLVVSRLMTSAPSSVTITIFSRRIPPQSAR